MTDGPAPLANALVLVRYPGGALGYAAARGCAPLLRAAQNASASP